MRVTVVSDIHLSAAAPVAQANWEAVVRHIAADAPDIVLHLGDLTRDGANGRRDLDHGRRQLDRLPVPWHAVPGNHDVGDNPSVDTPAAAAADAPAWRLRLRSGHGLSTRSGGAEGISRSHSSPISR